MGEFYSDNYDDKLKSYLVQHPGFVDYSDNLNESYFVSDIFVSYELFFINFLTPGKYICRLIIFLITCIQLMQSGKNSFLLLKETGWLGFRLDYKFTS